jgi:predicted aminopeptidase
VKTRPALLGVGALLSLAAGCGGSLYVARVGWSEARILMARQPIADVLARPDVDPALRARLELVLAVRAFATDTLGLRVGDSYATYAEVDGRAQVWVLSAARRDRLESHTWWYPIVGRVPYRGFFSSPEAEAAGRDLARDDLDVDVRPAVAFSTLGWFADPLLSTTATAPPVELAETVIHELFHATLWVKGATAFNESAATFVGHRGAAAFFCAGPAADADRCAAARRRWAAMRARGRVLGRLKGRLVRLYSGKPAPPARERVRTWLATAAARALERQKLGGGSELVPPNNARLLGELIYLSELDALDALAPTDADVGPAVATLVARTRGARDPFAAVRAAVVQTDGRTLDSGT